MRTLRNVVLMTAAPVLLAVAGLFHPHGLTTATADRWADLHILLLPVFPLVTLGFVIPLWGRPGRDLAGLATVVAWLGAFTYATFYTGLDAVAGIAAGTIGRHAPEGTHLRPRVLPLYHQGDALGLIGAYGFGVAAVALSVALFLRHGARTLPGAAILLAASYSFLDSHIFWPRGVYTMLAMALAFALTAWTATGAAPAGDGAPAPERVRA